MEFYSLFSGYFQIAIHLILSCNLFFDYLILSSMSWILMLKYWLIHYDVQWTRYTLNSKWIIHLNPASVQYNWYLRNKRKFGNFKYCIKRLSGFLLILFFLNLFKPTIIGHFGLFVSTILSILTHIFPALTILVLYLRMYCSKFEDTFYVIKELRYITIIFFATLPIFAIIGTVPIALGATVYTRAVMVASQIGITAMMIVLMQTALVTHWINKDVRIKAKAKRAKENEESSQSSSNKTDYDEIVKMLQDENEFERFVEHLMTEWSMEILLCLVEVTQIQSVIKQSSDTESQGQSTSTTSNGIKLTNVQEAILGNDGIVKSYIVYHEDIKQLLKEYNAKYYLIDDADKLGDIGQDELVQIKCKLYVLYLKYIINGAELQINISYEQKARLDQLMSNFNYFVNKVNMTNEELFGIYGDIVIELSNLLSYSFVRFVFNQQ